MNKKEILNRALTLQASGELYPPGDMELDDLFDGSIDRFCDIAFKLQNAVRILDVGAGHGMLSSLLSSLGHECHAVDFFDQTEKYPAAYRKKFISFQQCNVEIDPLPFADDFFDGVVCCQVLEHFTHSHLPAVKEMRRVMKTGGIIEIDVPNAVCFHNRSRMIRGKHITFDYAEHYLHAVPESCNGMSFYPARHNREFTRNELQFLLKEAGFQHVDITFLKSRRHRKGLERMRSIGSALRDVIPSFRKSLIAFAEK
jgi:SAM-dependent methyltransferase